MSGVIAMDEAARASEPWVVVIPVKRLAEAKSRLAAFGPWRTRFALAALEDTLAAALACPSVRDVVVVTSDAVVARLARRQAATVADEADVVAGAGLAGAVQQNAAGTVGSYGKSAGAGSGSGEPRLNSVLAAFAHHVAPGTRLAVLPADLPTLRPADLTTALHRASRHPFAYVPDADGAGTTLLTAIPAERLRPAFGVDSAQRHAVLGAVCLDLAGLQRLRLDVDTPCDLVRAADMGLGARTEPICRQILRAFPEVCRTG